MILLQIAPNMPFDLERLQKALHAFPNPGKVAVEFRHPGWFTQDTLGVLREAGATFCNVDSPQHRLSKILTSDRAYLRLHGRKHWYSYNYSMEEIHEIANLAQELAGRGAKRVYIFFNNDYEGFATINALQVLEMLTGRCT
jgi:uncharacterized protein YecE (DUF72 family)